jgi:hypothetical protein
MPIARGSLGPALTGSKFKPNFCKVLTTKPLQASSSRIAGCAFIPCGVRTISPSSRTWAARASARSQARQACVSISTPLASETSYSTSTRAHSFAPCSPNGREG